MQADPWPINLSPRELAAWLSGRPGSTLMGHLSGCGKRGVQTGQAPEPALILPGKDEGPGVWGSPPDIKSSPLLARKRVRGMGEGFFISLIGIRVVEVRKG